MTDYDSAHSTNFVKFLSVSTLPLIWGLLSTSPLMVQADEQSDSPAVTSTTASQNQTNTATLKASTTPTTSATSAVSDPSSDSDITEPATTQPTTTGSTTDASSTAAETSQTIPNQDSDAAVTSSADTALTENRDSTTVPPSATSTATDESPKTVGTINNAGKATSTSTPSEQNLTQLKAKITQAVTDFNTAHGTTYNVTDLRYQNGRLTIPLASNDAMTDSAAYQQLQQLQTAVIAEDRRYYLTNLAGTGMSLYFSINTETQVVTEGVTLAIPVIVEAVTDTGQVLQSTELKTTNGQQLLFNGSWSSSAPVITGYQWNNVDPTNASGTWNAKFDYTQLSDRNQLVIRYVYQPELETATITYIDDLTGKTLGTVTTNGAYGSTSSVDLGELLKDYTAIGYTLVASNLPDGGISYLQAGAPQQFTIRLKPASKADVPPVTKVVAPAITTPLRDEPLVTILPDDRDELTITSIPTVASPLTTTASEVILPEIMTSTDIETAHAIQIISIGKLTQVHQLGAYTIAGHAQISKTTDTTSRTQASAMTPSRHTETTNVAKPQPISFELAEATQPDTVPFRSDKRHNQVPQSDPVWTIIKHPDFIKEPGGVTHHSQLGQYLSSISGTVNFGASSEELLSQNNQVPS